MMRRFALIACLFAATACHKKSSREFYDAQGRYSVITARLGDDAYGDDEMNQIEAVLRAVPTNAKEAAQAQALLTTIEGERARVNREKAELAKPIAAAAPVAYVPSAPMAPAIAPTGIVTITAKDAGFAPQRGMALDKFLTAYGACMDPADDMLLPGAQKPGRAFAVRKTEGCQAQFGGSARFTKLYVFENDKLMGEATRSEPDPSTPHGGMSQAEFIKNFGTCMSAAPEMTMPGGKAPSQVFSVNKTKECTDKYGGAGDNVVKAYVFTDGKMVGETTQGITKPAPPPPAFGPGASLPSGVNSALPPPDPSTAVTPDSNQR